MTVAEFQAREALVNLRCNPSRVGAMRYLSATGVSLNLINRLRVEFGFDAEGMIPAEHLQSAIDLVAGLNVWPAGVDVPEARGTLREEMRRVVGGDYPFPSRGGKRGPRKRKSSYCWWYEPRECNVHRERIGLRAALGSEDAERRRRG